MLSSYLTISRIYACDACGSISWLSSLFCILNKLNCNSQFLVWSSTMQAKWRICSHTLCDIIYYAALKVINRPVWGSRAVVRRASLVNHVSHSVMILHTENAQKKDLFSYFHAGHTVMWLAFYFCVEAPPTFVHISLANC